uniref:AsIV-cont00024-ORF1 n=1 Tax=Apophua simplicipes ichnovirus TaxID=1329648 RepID=S5DR39_9VIRU|nr:AsIV-cont00024-ORF1 [Apophua simplicipes ichnovirus]
MLRRNMNRAEVTRLDQLLEQFSSVNAELRSFRVKQRLTFVEKIQKMMLQWKKRKIMNELWQLVKNHENLKVHEKCNSVEESEKF